MEYPRAFGNSFSCIIPSPLGTKPIRVVAPSGPFDPLALESGLKVLQRYPGTIRCSDYSCSRRDGLFAASDQQRTEELQAALDEPDTGLVLIARGGYGISRIIEKLDWHKFKQFPKWLMGFSDATVLHLQAFKQGIATIHGPNVTTLPHLLPKDLQRLDEILSSNAASQSLNLVPVNERAHQLQLKEVRERKAPLIGGNLTVIFSELAAAQEVNFGDKWLALEDISETSYRIDRMLVALTRRFDSLDAGARPKGILLGEFTNCSSGKWNVSTEKVLQQFADESSLPVFSGFPFGHDKRNYSFIHGCSMVVNP